MTMQTVFTFNKDGYFVGQDVAYNGIFPSNSTSTPPPATPWSYVWQKWDSSTSAWVQVDDFRDRPAATFGPDLAQQAQPYWLPGDTYQTAGRVMTEIGSYPTGATTTQPQETLQEAKISALSDLNVIQADQMYNKTFSYQMPAGSVFTFGVVSTVPENIGFPTTTETIQILETWWNKTNVDPNHLIGRKFEIGNGVAVEFDSNTLVLVRDGIIQQNQDCVDLTLQYQDQINSFTTVADIKNFVATTMKTGWPNPV